MPPVCAPRPIRDYQDTTVIERTVTLSTPVHFAELPEAGAVNDRLANAFQREKRRDGARRSHHFFGRYENTYIDAERLPELAPVTRFVERVAHELAGTTALRHGFWFNEMQPGHKTSLHSHEEMDECLSAVYYVTCPDRSGRLILHDDDARIVVTPRPGLLVMFAPDLPHEVESNDSEHTRLSLAFNFGPLNPAT